MNSLFEAVRLHVFQNCEHAHDVLHVHTVPVVFVLHKDVYERLDGGIEVDVIVESMEDVQCDLLETRQRNTELHPRRQASQTLLTNELGHTFS